jgi:hypothetical protein
MGEIQGATWIAINDAPCVWKEKPVHHPSLDVQFKVRVCVLAEKVLKFCI